MKHKTNKPLIFLAFFVLIAFVSCDGKAPACETISWGEVSSINGIEPVLLYSAGENCSNYGDYFDEDINSVIELVRGMKLKLIEGQCVQDGAEPQDGQIDNCPDWIFDEIIIGEMVGCEFETPPEELTVCLQGPLNMVFETNAENFSRLSVVFNSADNLTLYKEHNDDIWTYSSFHTEGHAIFGFGKEEKHFSGCFSKENLSEVSFIFGLSEDGVDFELKYTVESNE